MALLFTLLIVTPSPSILVSAAPPRFGTLLGRTTRQRQLPSKCCAFAGGFGSGSSSKKKKIPKNKKRKGGLLLDEELLSPPIPVAKSAAPKDELVLDKWGLPPPTEEDIFPRLPPGTDLTAAQKEHYSLAEILKALESRMKLPGLAQNFDQAGVEKQSPNTETATTPVTVKLVHESPPVLVFDNFLTEEECLNIQRVAMPDDTPPAASDAHHSSQPHSPVQVDSATFSTLAQSRRTSTSWFCHYAAVPTVLAKARHLLGVDIDCMEEPQIVRYENGQEFSWHYDEVPTAQLDNGGQRVGTFLIYLNHVARGGGTIFRDLSNAQGQPLTVQPRQGRVCLFFPADGQGRPDDRTLHKGEVAQDEKRIIQIWFHERAYRASLPPDNRQEAALDAVHREAQRLGYLYLGGKKHEKTAS